MILTSGMAGIWTQSDIDTLKAACASGVLTVIYAGPPQRQVTYQSLSAMRSLLSEMVRDVNGTPAYRYAQFNKGFDPNGSNGSSGSGGFGCR